MRLKKITVNGYLSVKKEEILLLDERVTILIGANDHGKTNLLTAIQCLNDENKIKPEDRNWDLPPDFPVELKWHFAVSEEMLTKLDRLVPKIEESRTEVQVPPETVGLPTEAQTPPEECFPINEAEEIVFSRDIATNVVKIESLPLKIPISKGTDVLQLRPRIELFEPPAYNLVDQVNSEQLNQAQFEFMQGIFILAEIWDLRKEIFTQNDTTSRILDDAATRLTKILNDRWNQGKDLKWKLEHAGSNGDHISIKIQDPAIERRYTRPSLRSSGFRTYFLLSMLTLARTQNKPSNSYIFLFDEPGIYLHPAAQLDLQRSFESLADRTQIVYATHSLFLINKNYPDRNRVISKTKEGTTIDQKPFSKNWKSVRESLGILLSNNFLIAEKTLLVEGPSDVIYILDAIKKLKSLGSLDIDLNDFSVVDAGNYENYVAMAKLMLSEGRGVVAVIDGDKAGEIIKKKLEKACEAKLLSKDLKILELPKNKSSEDVFVNAGLIKEAIKNVFENLINCDRKKKDELNIDAALSEIKPEKDKTFGQIIDQVTEKWFEPEEKISKLSIALEYENLRQTDDGKVPVDALAELVKIKEALNLREEKSAESGVFDEVE